MNRYLILLLLPALVIAGGNKVFSSPKIVTAKKDTVKNCGCAATIINKFPGYRYYPALTDELNYATFADATGWQLEGGKDFFGNLFMSNFQSSYGDYSFFIRLSVITRKGPIKLAAPDHSYTLNLTPCINETGDYILPLSINYSHRILQDVRNFNAADRSQTHFSTIRL